MDRRLTLIFWIVLVLFIIFFISYTTVPVKEVLLSFDTELVDTPEMVTYVLDVLAEHEVKATFFLTGEFVTANPELTKRIADEGHEVACYTMTYPRLPEVKNETQLEWELAGCKELVEQVTGKRVTGFRAPENLIDERSFALLPKLGYVYDASTFENLAWFSPPPPAGFGEVPMSSLGLLPLEDNVVVNTLNCGDFGFFLMRMDKDERVSLAFHPRNVYQHQEAFEYLLAGYAKDPDVTFKTHADVAVEQGLPEEAVQEATSG